MLVQPQSLKCAGDLISLVLLCLANFFTQTFSLSHEVRWYPVDIIFGYHGKLDTVPWFHMENFQSIPSLLCSDSFSFALLMNIKLSNLKLKILSVAKISYSSGSLLGM